MVRRRVRTWGKLEQIMESLILVILLFLVGVKNNGEKFTIDFRETAPEKSSRDMYLDKNGKANALRAQPPTWPCA